jgi:hypothetical protein
MMRRTLHANSSTALATTDSARGGKSARESPTNLPISSRRLIAARHARMDTGIRVNAELAEWAGVPRRLKRAEESPPEGEPSAKRRETP